MTRALVGLGGNLGDPLRQMGAALRALDGEPGQAVVAVSPAYRTPPWGRTDQPDFLNACAAVETDRSPLEFLSLCLEVERRLHRERRERWGPRTIDLDILDFGGRHVREEALSLPHPRMRERAFVLVPLVDIAPELAIDGRTARDWLAGLDASAIRLETAAPGWWRG